MGHFVPEYDTWFDKFAKDWGEKNKIAVTVDHIPVQNIPARAAAEASAGSGHDLFGFNGSGGAHLYRKFFIDVADLVKETEKKYGKVTTIGKQLGYNADDGTWSAFPDFYINFPGMYQKSLWDEIGMKPDTWDNLRIGGAKLKAKGHPVGISLGHSNDPSTTWRGLLWSYGASIQDEAGKKIVLNSKETVEATKYAAALYKEAMTADVLSWNDSSNNQYIDSGVGSYIINPISAYRTAQKLNKKLADDIFVIEPPKGPAKQIMGAASEFYGIWKFAKNKEAAMEFLRHYSANWPEAFKASEGYNNPCFAGLVPKPMPILSNDPTSTPHDKLAILQDFGQVVRHPGLSGAGDARDGRDLLPVHHQRHDGEGGDGSDERRRIGQVGHGAVRSHHEEMGRQGLIADSGPRAFARGPGMPALCGARPKGADTERRAAGESAARGATLNSGRFNGCGIDQGHRQEIWRGSRRQRHQL